MSITKISKDNIKCKCAFCDDDEMSMIIDFGEVALAGAFLKSNQFENELLYPMRLFFCHNCYAVQIVDNVDENVLFNDYFYFSSSIQTLCDHFNSYAVEVVEEFIVNRSKSTVIEFGCNDGVLLRPLADLNIGTLIGVDPASNIINTINDSRINIVNDFFNETTSGYIIKKYGKADMIIANNVFAHIPDMKGVTKAIVNTLSDNGVFIFEVHYLGKIIEELQYDMIYHEHLYYHSLISLQNHFNQYDMVIFNVKEISIHAGSMRFYVCKKGSKHATESINVVKLREEEIQRGFNIFDTFSRFSEDVNKQKNKLNQLLQNIKDKGQTIAGYGASGRANTIIQYCGIDHKLMDYIVDDAPAKIGFFTPGSHLEILPSSALSGKNAPDYVLVFAWSFFDEILKRNKNYIDAGGYMILPLPTVKTYPDVK